MAHKVAATMSENGVSKIRADSKATFKAAVSKEAYVQNKGDGMLRLVTFSATVADVVNKNVIPV